LANINLNENLVEEKMFFDRLMLNKLKFSQIKDPDEIVIDNENSNSVNGTLNSEFRSHEKFINYIPKLNGAEVNVGNTE
jgi:hypothetical protein